ncbi:PaaI family thioesterase [Sphingomonas ginkgonis]|uniref:PaaI family thioesterase n=1 Tax=Sphingomonas ginkgonis TaxID=2315330 RepID=A0A3R9WUU5_9SPHN|nr:PaaI family thioesterase [Sphingomonas ginkgonis]RST32311.1 PaaI family thioesterase [Sphingomonas ginkgonis]
MTLLPPYADLLKLRVEKRDGRPLIVMPFHEEVVGRPGFVHGGAIAGLLEIAAYQTLAGEIGDETVARKPVTVTVDFLRGGRSVDTFAAAQVQRLGKRIANVEAFAWQDDPDRPIAGGRINFLLERA